MYRLYMYYIHISKKIYYYLILSLINFYRIIHFSWTILFNFIYIIKVSMS